MQLCFILFAMLLRSAVPYSAGAPDAACGDMTPKHGVEPQTSIPPYTISSANRTISQGERTLIQIESHNSPFKGFFIQALDSSNSPIGSFLTTTYKTANCGDGFHNAITHSDATLKDKITLQWQPPQSFEGDVTFRATVVQSSKIFWINLSSKTVTVVKGSGDSVPEARGKSVDTPTAAQAPDEPQKLQRLVSDVYNDCETFKTCFGTPAECVANKNCEALATFTKAGDKYEFELLGKRSREEQYIAVGISDDAHMGDDAVVVCTSDGTNMDIYNAWNFGRDNRKVNDLYKGLTPLTTGFSDEMMYCSFRRNAQTSVNNRDFDLDKQTYHVLVASGGMNGGTVRYHGINRISTAQPVSLGLTSKLNSSNDRQITLIHACLMIAAWVSAASCGILFARYYKKTWLRYKCMNIDMWFHMHRVFMISAWSLTVASFILIVYTLKEFRVSYHSIVGVFSVAFCFIQPFMAALRCHPGTPKRNIFNWLHWLVGNSAQILGIAAIFLGLELFLGSDRHWVKEVCWYILVAFIAFHILVHLILTFTQCASDNRVKKIDNSFPMKDLTDSRMALQPEDVRPDAPMGCFRKFILGIYLAVNWIATALLIILLVVEREDLENTLSSWGVPSFWEDMK